MRQPWKPVHSGHPCYRLCRGIAAALPEYRLGTWSGHTALLSPVAKVIVVTASPDGRRLHFEGRYPEPAKPSSYWGGGRTYAISVGSMKRPDIIAADLERRLLPKYLPELRWVKEQVLRMNGERASREATVDELLRRLPGSRLSEPQSGRSRVYLSRSHNPSFARLTIEPSRNAEHADIEISGVSGTLLEAIVTALTEALDARQQ